MLEAWLDFHRLTLERKCHGLAPAQLRRRAVPPSAADRAYMAVMDFRHSGWDERREYLGFCNFQWGETLRKLKQWCASGQE